MRPLRLSLSGVVLLAGAAMAACTTSGPSTHTAGVAPAHCVNTNSLWTAASQSGSSLTVRTGAVVVFEVMEPLADLAPGPFQPFPWLQPMASPRSVLTRGHFCRASGPQPPSTLPVLQVPFVATSRGTAIIVSNVAPSWLRLKLKCEVGRKVCPSAEPIRIKVVVD
jgi:hypothetical protein